MSHIKYSIIRWHNFSKKNKSANIAYVLCRKISDLLADEVNINVSRMCQGWDSCCSSKSGYEIKLWLLYEYFIAE